MYSRPTKVKVSRYVARAMAIVLVTPLAVVWSPVRAQDWHEQQQLNFQLESNARAIVAAQQRKSDFGTAFYPCNPRRRLVIPKVRTFTPPPRVTVGADRNAQVVERAYQKAVARKYRLWLRQPWR